MTCFLLFSNLLLFFFPLPTPSAGGLVFGSAQACCFHMAAFGIQDSLSEVVERSQWMLCLCISFHWCLFVPFSSPSWTCKVGNVVTFVLGFFAQIRQIVWPVLSLELFAKLYGDCPVDPSFPGTHGSQGTV